MALDNSRMLVMGSPLILSASALLLVIAFIRFLLNRPKKLDLPVVEGDGSKDYTKALIEGSVKYPESPFIIKASTDTVILPIGILNETRNLPENKISFMKDTQVMFAAKYTHFGTGQMEMALAVKNDLTRHIASTLNNLQDEIKYALKKEFGPCSDWTPIPLYHKMARIVALLSGRVFVGLPLSREEEWIQASIMYTFATVEARDAVQAYPAYLRGIVARFLPEVKNVVQLEARGAELLKPIMDAQLSQGGMEKLGANGEDEQGTMVNWLSRYGKESDRRNPVVLANNQMALSMAAIHTTTMATTAAIYDLATHPELIRPLREEIEKVIEEDGEDINEDGFKKLKKSSMPKLWKLDSFLKESQRLTPPGLITNTRLTTSPLTLSTGHILPTGTRIAYNSWAVHTAPSTSLFTSTSTHIPLPPTVFDALRFYKLRKIPGNENKHQFVTTGPESLSFGHGNHACPGRFFASNEIKVVLIELLRGWEFRFTGDLEGKGGVERRPKNSTEDFHVSPNRSAEMEFRRRKSGLSVI